MTGQFRRDGFASYAVSEKTCSVDTRLGYIRLLSRE
jgi:hypothetical protein